jgi:hypothetical protein
VVQCIVSIAVAATNAKTGGYKSASFAAIWSMFLVIGFTTVGGQIVFGGKSSELLVGFMIGVAFMLCELFFVLMVAFFILGSEATHNGYGERSDVILLIFCNKLSLFTQYLLTPTRLTPLFPCLT